jgi:hypothetical protein
MGVIKYTRERLTDQELEQEKKKIDAMSQVEMARLWRFAPPGHLYFRSGTPLSDYFDQKFHGFTPEISKEVGLGNE